MVTSCPAPPPPVRLGIFSAKVSKTFQSLSGTTKLRVYLWANGGTECDADDYELIRVPAP